MGKLIVGLLVVAMMVASLLLVIALRSLAMPAQEALTSVDEIGALHLLASTEANVPQSDSEASIESVLKKKLSVADLEQTNAKANYERETQQAKHDLDTEKDNNVKARASRIEKTKSEAKMKEDKVSSDCKRQLEEYKAQEHSLVVQRDARMKEIEREFQRKEKSANT